MIKLHAKNDGFEYCFRMIISRQDVYDPIYWDKHAKIIEKVKDFFSQSYYRGVDFYSKKIFWAIKTGVCKIAIKRNNLKHKGIAFGEFFEDGKDSYYCNIYGSKQFIEEEKEKLKKFILGDIKKFVETTKLKKWWLKLRDRLNGNFWEFLVCIGIVISYETYVREGLEWKKLEA